jgi:hypothetical protein
VEAAYRRDDLEQPRAHNVVDVRCRLPTIDSWEAPTSDVIDTALRATRPGGKQGKRQRVNTGAFAISD